MDPLSALSVAGNIIQFVDFSSKLIAKSHKLYSSADGALVENLELEAIANSMSVLNGKVRDSLVATSAVYSPVFLDGRQRERRPTREEEQMVNATRENERAIRYVCEQCANVSGELLEALARLKVRGTNRRWASFRQALQSVWDEGKIEKLAERLQKLRAQFDTSILIALRLKIDETALQNSLVIGEVDNVMASTKLIRDQLLGHIQQSQRWQADVISAIYQSSWQAQNQNHIDQFSSKLSGMAEAQRTNELGSKFINRLRFPGMSDRKARIPEAHKKTFEWVYRDPEAGCKPWSSFVKWLETDGDLYWITGKPGSGKSTLMKFLYSNPRTWKHLKAWSAGQRLVTAGFFFWNSGTEMQMSDMGLVRTLLYDCLSQQPNLVSVAFAERWQASRLFGDDLHPWTWLELLNALENFLAEASKTMKIMFFIDGLDEFNGEHPELIQIFKRLSQHPNFKICLSSRPWIVFEDAFGQLPNLTVQDLTYPDIKIYVESRLFGNPSFCQLKAREPQYASKLIKEITGKSAGVFLWIHLVVHSLLEGLANSDRVSDLARRLELMPDDLDGLYKRILNSLDRFYFEHASQLFQIIRYAAGPLSLLELSFADEDDPEMAIRAEIRPMSQEEKEYRCYAMKRRLNSRCKGLLEVPALQPELGDPLTRREQSGHVQDNISQEESFYPPDELASLKVEYLHRTVKDFLEKPEVWNMLLAATKLPFDPSSSLSRGFLLRLKDHDEDKLTGQADNMWRAVTCCWRYAIESEINHDGSQTPILRELERVTDELQASPDGVDTMDVQRRKIDVITKQSAFLEHRTLTGPYQRRQNLSRRSTTHLSFNDQTELYRSVQSQLMQGYLIAQDTDGRPLLTLAVLDFEDFAVLRMRLLKLLLSHGLDPNQPYQSSTPWKDVVMQATADSRLHDSHPYHSLLMKRWAEVMELFIKHKAQVEVDPRAEGIRCIREVFWKHDPGMAIQLEELVESKNADAVNKKSGRLSKLFARRKG